MNDDDDDGDSKGDACIDADGRSPSLMTDGERALLLFALASLSLSLPLSGDDPPPPPSPSVPRRFVNSPAILDMSCTAIPTEADNVRQEAKRPRRARLGERGRVAAVTVSSPQQGDS